MTPEQAEAINTLRSNDIGAWSVFIGYLDDLLDFERDKCVKVDKERVQIHQGRARVLDELTNMTEKAEAVYESYKVLRGNKNAE